MQENPSVNFLNYWISNIKLPPADLVLEKQSAGKSVRETVLGVIFKSIKGIKINYRVKKSMYGWVIQHLQVVQSQISNDFLKVYT